jgi:hypothetical protein
VDDLDNGADFDDEGNLLEYTEEFNTEHGIGVGSSDGGIPDYQTKSI